MKKSLLTACLLLAGCSSVSTNNNYPSKVDIVGRYSYTFVRDGGSCPANNSEIKGNLVIEDDAFDDVTVALEGMRGTCLAQYNAGRLEFTCDIPYYYFWGLYDYKTLQSSWVFDNNSFTGSTTVANNYCFTRYAVSGLQQ